MLRFLFTMYSFKYTIQLKQSTLTCSDQFPYNYAFLSISLRIKICEAQIAYVFTHRTNQNKFNLTVQLLFVVNKQTSIKIVRFFFSKAVKFSMKFQAKLNNNLNCNIIINNLKRSVFTFEEEIANMSSQDVMYWARMHAACKRCYWKSPSVLLFLMIDMPGEFLCFGLFTFGN